MVGQGGESVHRTILEPGQGLGSVLSEEVAAARRPDKQAATREHRFLSVSDENQIGHVFRCVAGGVEGTKHEIAEDDVLLVECGSVAKDRRGTCWHHQVGAVSSRQVLASRHVVVVEMGLHDGTKGHVLFGEDTLEPVDVTLRVDNDCEAVVDEDVGRVAETLRANRLDARVQS
jgi:hypothetical protein